jgi:hypothetical protein
LQGYIKDFRKELESAIWMMPPLYHRIWQYLKYTVNHQDNTIPMRDGTFLAIKAGQHLTSVREVAKNVGWYEGVKYKEPNPKTVSTILEWLEKQSMIKIERGKGNRQYTLISLSNWDLYQQKNVEGNSKVTDREQCADINKNDKECPKNDLNIAATDTHAYEESDGVPTTDPLRGDPVPSGEISQTSENAVKILIDRFIQLRAYGFTHSPADEMAAQEILSAGISLENALVYLKDRFDTYTPKHPRDRINSLSYCAGYIFDKHYQKLESLKLQKNPPARKGSYKKPIRQEIVPDYMNQDYVPPQDVDQDELEAKRRQIQEKLKRFNA